MDFLQVCTLLLQCPRRNAVQDAATFARLLCVSKQLQGPLLAAAQGCIRAEVPRCCSSASTDRSVVQWLCQHVRLGTIRHVEVEADDFHPDLYALLSKELQLQQPPHPPSNSPPSSHPTQHPAPAHSSLRTASPHKQRRQVSYAAGGCR